MGLAMANGTDAEVLNHSLSGAGKRILPRVGDLLYAQGEPADALFYLERGRIKVSTTSSQGKEAIIAIVSCGEFFGESSLAGQAHRNSTASAIVASSVFRIERAAALRLLENQPGFSNILVRRLITRNLRLEADIIDHLFNSSEKRLARVLFLLANFSNDGSPRPVSTQFSQEVLAEMIGTTRSRVNFFMNKFRRLGFIDYKPNRQLHVHRSLLNVLLYDEARSDVSRAGL
jgi:CRP-like cAMP-binding protein